MKGHGGEGDQRSCATTVEPRNNNPASKGSPSIQVNILRSKMVVFNVISPLFIGYPDIKVKNPTVYTPPEIHLFSRVRGKSKNQGGGQSKVMLLMCNCIHPRKYTCLGESAVHW